MGQCASQKYAEDNQSHKIDKMMESIRQSAQPTSADFKNATLFLADQIKQACIQYAIDKNDQKNYLDLEFNKLRTEFQGNIGGKEKKQDRLNGDNNKKDGRTQENSTQGSEIEAIRKQLKEQMSKNKSLTEQMGEQLSFETNSWRQCISQMRAYQQNMQNMIMGKVINFENELGWLSKQLDVKIQNLDYDLNIKASNLEQKLEQRESCLTQETQDDKQIEVPKSLSAVQKSSEWVDKQSFYYSKLKMQRNIIKYESTEFSNFAFVFGSKVIRHAFNFSVKIEQAEDRVAIGLANNKYSKKWELGEKDNNWLFYFSNGEILGDGNITSNIKKRDTYKKGDIIKLRADLKEGKVEWLVNGKVSCIYYWKVLKDSTVKLVASLYLSKNCSISLV